MHVRGSQGLRDLLHRIELKNSTCPNQPNLTADGEHPSAMMVTPTSEPIDEILGSFILDSGAEYHMVRKLDVLHNVEKIADQPLNLSLIHISEPTRPY